MAFYANAPLPDTNARQSAITIRPSSTALLTIDSEDRHKDYVEARDTPSSPYNFSITKRESLMPGFMTRIGVSELCFPWTIPNINVKTSTIGIQYQIGAAAPVVEAFAVDIGFYTPALLAQYIQEFITTSTPLAGFTMDYGIPAIGGPGTFPQNQPVFRYDAGAGNLVGFFPLAPNSVAAGPLPAYPYPATTKQLFDLMGFTNLNVGLQASGVGGYTLCQAIRYVDIICNQLTNSQSQKDQTSQTIARDMLCRLYLGSGSGDSQSTIEPSNPAFCPPGCAPFVIYRNFTMPKQIQWIPNQNIPGYLQFQVYDDAGDLLDNSLLTEYLAAIVGIPNQYSDWSMTMLVSEC